MNKYKLEPGFSIGVLAALLTGWETPNANGAFALYLWSLEEN